jgi:ubiquinone biosynthesis monooxygenase Coq7
MVTRRVRPTVLQPLWHVAGYALGIATAALGPKAAMACTEAVEEVIDEHYARQVAELGDDEAELRDICERYRREEVEHGETAVRLGARESIAYRPLTEAIKAGSRAAIWLAERF